MSETATSTGAAVQAVRDGLIALLADCDSSASAFKASGMLESANQMRMQAVGARKAREIFEAAFGKEEAGA